MTEHVSADAIERFHQNAMTAGDRTFLYDHLLKCEVCRQQIIGPEIEAVALDTLFDHLLPEGILESPHLTYNVIESYIDHKLDTAAQNEVEAHLDLCSQCLAEVTDLRESLATMSQAFSEKHKGSIRLRFQSFVRRPTLSSPLQVSVMIALVVLALIAVAVVWRLRSGAPSRVPSGDRDLTAGSKPTPTQLPSNASPSPSPGPSPQPSHGSPSKGKNEPGQELLALNDGPNKIILDKSGKVAGLESLPLETQRTVREVLLTNKINEPDILEQLRVADVSLRAPSEDDEQVHVVYPSSTVITEDTPRLEWSPAKGATGYRIEIGDSNYHQVAKSEDLGVTTRSWIPPTPLRRGGVYTWTVRAIDSDGKISTSQAKFKVLSAVKMDELNRLRTTTRSKLALGVFYAREGMVSEAEREFQALAKQNPHSATARRLLNQIRSWQKPLN